MIGAEFASVYTDLGVQTTLLEAMNDGVLPVGPDRDVANVLAKSLAKRGTKIYAEAKVGALQHTETGIIVPFETPKGSDKIEVDQVLVVDRPPAGHRGHRCRRGRRRVDERGFIEVDTNTMRTTRPGVYAIGDCVATPGLAHVAYAEAVVAVDQILGEQPGAGRLRQGAVGRLHPSRGGVVRPDRGAGQGGRSRRRGAQALVRRQRPGDDPRRDRRPGEDCRRSKDGPILGFHIVGPWASELLHEGYLAVNWEALPSDVGRLIHAHPSLSEAIGETMITFSGRSLHG